MSENDTKELKMLDVFDKSFLQKFRIISLKPLAWHR